MFDARLVLFPKNLFGLRNFIHIWRHPGF